MTNRSRPAPRKGAPASALLGGSKPTPAPAPKPAAQPVEAPVDEDGVVVPPRPPEVPQAALQPPPEVLAVTFERPSGPGVAEDAAYVEAEVAQEAPALSPEEKAGLAFEAYVEMLEAMPSTETIYLCGNRAPLLKVANHQLRPGDVVPGAEHWPRRDSWERTGQLVRA